MGDMQNLLVTGSSGFVGKELLKSLSTKYNIRPISLRSVSVEDVDFNDIDCVLHLAGMAHQMQKIDPQIYFDVNRDLTLKLASKAKSSGVRGFVFISSVKVYGDANSNEVQNELSACSPNDPYGQSKFEAELGLGKLDDPTFSVAIIRAPLVYGSGVKGNLSRIMKLVKMLPVLPLGGVGNERSMVYVGNLIALIDKVIDTNSNGVFIAGDQKPHSTSRLVELIANNLGKKVINFKLPSFLVNAARLIAPGLVSRLFDSYIIDNKNTNALLSFKPPYTFEQGIMEMVIDFKKDMKK